MWCSIAPTWVHLDQRQLWAGCCNPLFVSIMKIVDFHIVYGKWWYVSKSGATANKATENGLDGRGAAANSRCWTLDIEYLIRMY